MKKTKALCSCYAFSSFLQPVYIQKGLIQLLILMFLQHPEYHAFIHVIPLYPVTFAFLLSVCVYVYIYALPVKFPKFQKQGVFVVHIQLSDETNTYRQELLLQSDKYPSSILSCETLTLSYARTNKSLSRFSFTSIVSAQKWLDFRNLKFLLY